MTTDLRLVSPPTLVRTVRASSEISVSSSSHLILRICLRSFSSYWVVGMMIVLSSRSRGRPWGLVYCVPRILVMP